MNDSEDADLEFLRQAALSSLLKKKNIPSTTNAVFYNPSAKPNLISIQPVKEEYYEENEDDNTAFSTEYVIAEGLSVSSSDVDEIVEEVIVSEGDEGDGNSSEGEDAVSVASKDSFDEILNSIEEEVKDTKSGVRDKVNPVKRKKPDDTSSSREKLNSRETNPRGNPGSSSRRRSRSPINIRPYSRRPANDSRKSPTRHLHNRRSRSRSPPPLRRRSPVNDRKDTPSSFDNRRRTRTRSPAENRRPGTRSPVDIKYTRSPLDDRRLRGPRSSLDGRRPRSRSPRRRSRSPLNNRRYRSRSPFVRDNRRRRSRSPYRRRPILENNRRYGRRTRSRSPIKILHLNERKVSSKSPNGDVSKVSSLSEGDKNSTEGEDNVNAESSSSRKSHSPENRKLSEALKLNTDRSTPRSDREREPYRKRQADNSRSGTHRDRRSRSRSPGRSRDQDRRGDHHRRSSPGENVRTKRRKSQSRSPTGRKNPKSRTPSPPRNLSKEEREVFEKRKRKFQANVNVSKLSGKIKLKSNKSENPDGESQEKNGSQTSCSSNSEKTDGKVKVSDKKSELSSRLGAIVPEELQYTSETSNPTTAAGSSPEQSSEETLVISVQEDEPIKSAGLSSDETKEDLRTKLQQKRATGIGRLFSVALQDTLSTSSSPEDSPRKSLKKKAPTSFN